MKTKYIRVKASERLPVANMSVILIDGFNNSFEGHLSDNKNWIIYTDGEFEKVEYWLEEVPDMEDEMREMLEEAKDKLMDIDWSKYPKCLSTYEKIQTLLTKLKTKES
ncbi:hypothetical protein [Chryseobacterium sp.]|uniref:hypothetical protein n=1 Tax=Chryseobacterium sp. TaxID=1871047 RepID=UPI0024E25AB0|nr:hypothetical protein [Chryseobacterium sp.]